MIGIIKGICEHICTGCHTSIEKGIYKVKDSQDNSNRKYYHFACVPREMAIQQLQSWQQVLNEQESRQ